jgi:hypothetical protein
VLYRNNVNKIHIHVTAIYSRHIIWNYVEAHERPRMRTMLVNRQARSHHYVFISCTSCRKRKESFSPLFQAILIYTRCNWKVQTNFGNELHIPKQEKNVHINMCPETFKLWVTAEMPFMKFNSRLDTSRHRPPHPFKDVGVVADSLTGIHTATVKPLFVVNMRCAHEGF